MKVVDYGRLLCGFIPPLLSYLLFAALCIAFAPLKHTSYVPIPGCALRHFFSFPTPMCDFLSHTDPSTCLYSRHPQY